MRFLFPINEPEVNEELESTSITLDVVETDSDCARTNKRKLKQYLSARGVPEEEHKKVLKAMGFWGEALGS